MMKQLSDEGLSSRAIATRMQEHGLNISHNTVYRCLTERRKTDAVI
jgi:transposase-like protein